ERARQDHLIAQPPNHLLFFFKHTHTTEIYTLSYTTLFRSRQDGDRADAWELPAGHDDLAPHRHRRPAARLFGAPAPDGALDEVRSEEHTSELQSRSDLVCRLLLEKKKNAVMQRCKLVRHNG